MLSDTQREWKRVGHCEARIRVQYPGEKYMANVLVQESMHDARRNLVEAMMILAAMDGAACVGLTMEAWIVPTEEMNLKQRKAALDQARDRLLHEHPNRVESISVTYNSADLECAVMSTISRGPDRLGAWEFLATNRTPETEKLGVAGKFSGIFGKANDAEYRAWVEKLLGPEIIRKYTRRRGA